MFRRIASRFLSVLPGYSSLRFRQRGGSRDYWERRYREGGNSGDGSYGRLAEFKAQVLNRFVSDNQIETVVEFGCGDGNQLSLARYPRYLGLDVSPTAIRNCSARFSGDASKSFQLYDPRAWSDSAGWLKADAALSLDVLYHLVEDEIYHLYLKHLFAASQRFVVIYSSDSAEPPPAPHVRPRAFSVDVKRAFPEFSLERIERVPWETGFDNYAADKTPASFHFFRRR
jgi:cyclopropane fatty-acyl-phospholipid synthase-like methyltransferase